MKLLRSVVAILSAILNFSFRCLKTSWILLHWIPWPKKPRYWCLIFNESPKDSQNIALVLKWQPSWLPCWYSIMQATHTNEKLIFEFSTLKLPNISYSKLFKILRHDVLRPIDWLANSIRISLQLNCYSIWLLW